MLPRCIAAARKAVGRAAIQTLHGRGYRFVAAVSDSVPPAHAVAAEGAAMHEHPTSPFVGREAVMAELDGALGHAIAGRDHPRVVGDRES